jgi:predicted GNAT superfamily acetyltransferase
LKWAQRERVLAQGMDCINWTFDPLQTLNAHLNIERLGVVVTGYSENVYGESGGHLHGGIPTDRFEVDWWIESPGVRERLNGSILEKGRWDDLPCINRTGREGKFIRCEEVDFEQGEQELLVEVPFEITAMIAQDKELAFDWRMKSRRLFQTYFRRGYAVTGFRRSDERALYRLESLLDI